MRPTQLDIYRKQVINSHPHNDTIKGILLNNYIKKDSFERVEDFDRISNELLIPAKLELPHQEEKASNQEKSFDFKKALKPALIASGVALGGLLLISGSVNKYSKIMADKNDIVRPGDLARNINILEEPHFAAYRMLRDPNAKNVAGFIGVCLMSAVTLISKNLVDGVKEIWIKKQNCDIEHNLQESLIQVEAEAFSGKLNVVNTLLSDTTNYFKSVLSSNNSVDKPNFKSFLSFKGNVKNESKEEKNNLKTILTIGAGVLGFVGLSFLLFKNYQKTLKNLETFVQKFEHNEISSKIINATENPDKTSAIKELKDIFKVINATQKTMEENLAKVKGISPEEIQDVIKEVSQAQIYAQAPEALGGISEKIQYYCYINEERGHLYNWILNPENKFNKYLFLCFSAISAIGYIGKQSVDAIKDVIVNRENSKSELSLKKRLVNTEINNFKAKKLSAINPLIDNFIRQLEQGKPKEELKQMAENILIEIKNGPPYVYS